jgi:hypothetical protein
VATFVGSPSRSPWGRPVPSIARPPRSPLGAAAERFFLSQATIKTHVGRLLTKLAARDRTQLVVIAYESGWVTPGG